MSESLVQSAPPAAARSRFLDLRALSALEHMRFATNHQIEGSYSGRHRSKQQGGAGEFADYREYVAGEDLRRLDWKVLARTGRAYTRLFQDETNLLCTLVLDASESMRFDGGAPAGKGRSSKLEYAQYLSTALSQVITRQQDAVGLAVIGRQLGQVITPGSTQGHVLQLQSVIETLRTEPSSNLAGGFRELFTRLPRRGVLVVMSDFLVDDLEQTFAALRLFRHRRWEVIAIHLVHPQEERLPPGLAYRFEGMEGEGRIDCSPGEIARVYEERFAAHIAAVRSLALGVGCDYRRVSTATPYLQTLGGFLVERAG